MKRQMLTLLEFMTYLRYPTCLVDVMDHNGNTIKTFDSIDYELFETYKDCLVSTIKDQCNLVKENHFAASELVVSFSSTIIVKVWEK